MGTLYSKNVTQIAACVDDATLEAIILGWTRFLGAMPTGAYQSMASDDMADLIAYLRQLKRVDHAIPVDQPDPAPGHPLRANGCAAPRAPSPGTMERGRYLPTHASCDDCHTPRGPDGTF